MKTDSELAIELLKIRLGAYWGTAQQPGVGGNWGGMLSTEATKKWYRECLLMAETINIAATEN